jgi:hypothetical protein
MVSIPSLPASKPNTYIQYSYSLCINIVYIYIYHNIKLYWIDYFDFNLIYLNLCIEYFN